MHTALSDALGASSPPCSAGCRLWANRA